MEFPNLGQHCSELSCHKLDFLPMKCDGCDKVFCSSHFRYESHSCSSNRIRNHQVPLCPLCGEPVPTAPGVEPDRTVSQHIDQQCRSDDRKIFTNRCCFEKCKKKELIPFNCSQCKQNYCLRHRHSADHNCKGSKAIINNEQEQKRTTAMNAVKARMQKSSNLLPTLFQKQNTRAMPKPSNRLVANSTQTRSIQGDMTDDEALARAIAQSIIDLDEKNQVEKESTINNNSTTTVSVGGSSKSSDGHQKDNCRLS